MAQLTVTVPDAQVDRVRNAFANRVGKDAADVTAQDLTDQLIDFVKKVVRNHEEDVAFRNALDAVTDVDAT